jgi:hypothetical protein
LLKGAAFETGGIKMKKIIVFVALVCALGAFVGRPSADVPHQAAVETLSPFAMMQESRSLPTEVYDTF